MKNPSNALQFLGRKGIAPRLDYSREGEPETVSYIWQTAGNRQIRWEIDQLNQSKIILDNMVMIENVNTIHAIGYMQSRPRTFLTQEPV